MAMPNAPIWHRPTPCPHPEPLKTTLALAVVAKVNKASRANAAKETKRDFIYSILDEERPYLVCK